jgi:hypothetical protein
MSKCSRCQNDFMPLLKSNELPYKTCVTIVCLLRQVVDGQRLGLRTGPLEWPCRRASHGQLAAPSLAPRGRPAQPLRGPTALLWPSFDAIGGEALSWSPRAPASAPARPPRPPPHRRRAQRPPTLSTTSTSPSQPCERARRAPQRQNEPKLTSRPCHTTDKSNC